MCSNNYLQQIITSCANSYHFAVANQPMALTTSKNVLKGQLMHVITKPHELCIGLFPNFNKCNKLAIFFICSSFFTCNTCLRRSKMENLKTKKWLTFHRMQDLYHKWSFVITWCRYGLLGDMHSNEIVIS